MNVKFLNNKALLVTFGLVATFLSSCTFSVTPVWNSNKDSTPELQAKPAKVTDRDDLKSKAIEQVTLLHRLMNEGKFDEAYDMIDDKSPLKLPKDKSLDNMKEIIDQLGKFESMELTRDMVVDDASLNGGQLQVRQEFIVKFAKDTPAPKRFELFNWNAKLDGTLKFWSYINSKGGENE